jgi:hypothetical protein
VLGVHLEELARIWTGRFAPAEFGQVGFTVVSDPAARTTHEVDVAATAASGRRRLVLLGEAKHGRVGRRDLERLRRIRELLAARGDAAPDAKLALFTLTGFEPALARTLDRDREILVDVERLYGR